MLRYNAIVFRQLYSKVIKLKEIFDAIVASCSLYQAATYHFFSIEILINKQTLAFFFYLIHCYWSNTVIVDLDIVVRTLSQAYKKVKVILNLNWQSIHTHVAVLQKYNLISLFKF